ncbi:MAG: hypothetical protein ACYDH1_21260, partial [Anaerolineaceae bacterium]
FTFLSNTSGSLRITSKSSNYGKLKDLSRKYNPSSWGLDFPVFTKKKITPPSEEIRAIKSFLVLIDPIDPKRSKMIDFNHLTILHVMPEYETIPA